VCRRDGDDLSFVDYLTSDLDGNAVAWTDQILDLDLSGHVVKVF
jgi:hypothetical protein